MLGNADGFNMLLRKRIEGSITIDQQKQLDDLVASSESYARLYAQFTNPDSFQELLKDYTHITAELKEADAAEVAAPIKELPTGSTQSRNLFRMMAAAAAVLLLVSTGAYFLFFPSIRKVANVKKTNRIVADVAPGSAKATLTMDNNKTINLTDAAAGVVAQQDKASFKKTSDGMLTVEGSGSTVNAGTQLLSTPNGGYYHITLSDGSRVWLNAASTLRFPSVFTGKQRMVELSGEGYFEVTHNADMPFVVVLKNEAKIQVLGTRFNAHNYAEESTGKTTLLEGSVKISTEGTFKASKVLVPGQQAELNLRTGSFEVKEVNAQATIAWTKGTFSFSRTSLVNVMHELARWYDVKIVYEQGIDALGATGTIQGRFDRTQPLSIVLAGLEKIMGDVHFTMDAQSKTIHVSKP
jgi:transmembrane sensor